MLPFHRADEAYRLEMQFGQLDEFVHISPGMEQVLMQLLCMIEAYDCSGIIRAVQDAKNGKMACSCAG